MGPVSRKTRGNNFSPVLSLLLIISAETFALGQGRDSDENIHNLSYQDFGKAVSFLLKIPVRFTSSFAPTVSASQLLGEMRS